MYAYIKGIVSELSGESVIIETSGIGYELHVSAKTAEKLVVGSDAKLYTHLHLADGIQALYGFYTIDEREMFRRLITVTRVGPKLAISVLSQMTPQDIATAVITDTQSAFDSVSGMGRKTAQRVILDLKGQLKGFLNNSITQPDNNAAMPTGNMQMDAISALTALGYDGLTASKAVTQITDADSVEILITKALRKLARQ